MACRMCSIRDYREHRLWFVVVLHDLRADHYSARIFVLYIVPQDSEDRTLIEMIQNGFCQPCRHRRVFAFHNHKTWGQP